MAWQFRENRFRGSWLAGIPCPVPEHYLAGFDEQKIETEGIPIRLWTAVRDGKIAEALPETSDDEKTGYPVYLNGAMRRSGWWYYYLLTLLYKVPEGTWMLVILSLPALTMTIRTRPHSPMKSRSGPYRW